MLQKELLRVDRIIGKELKHTSAKSKSIQNFIKLK